MKQDNYLRLDVDLDILQSNAKTLEPRIPEKAARPAHCAANKLCWRCRLGQRLIKLGQNLTKND